MANEQDDSGWDYKPSGGAAVADAPQTQIASGVSGQPPDSRSSMVWTASEFIEHQRGPSWYFMLLLATAVLAGLAYLMTSDYFAVGVIIILGIIVGVSAGRKPPSPNCLPNSALNAPAISDGT